MLRYKIKDIIKDSSIYGFSKVLGQIVSFFLIPLYTSYLTLENYGILNIIGLFSGSLSLLMNFGIDSATYRFVGMNKDDDEIQKEYIGNSQILSIFSILFFTVITLIFLQPLNKFALSTASPLFFLIVGIGNGIFTSISAIPRAYLRINRKVKVIAISTLINVFGSIASTLIFVVVLKYGILGALLGNLVGTLLSTIYILKYTPKFTFKIFNRKKSNELIKYCLPTLPTQIFAFAIPLYSQWSVKQYLSFNDLGLYAIGLKFTLPLIVGLSMFQQSYAPYKYQIIQTDENPQDTFSKIMNVFIIVFGFSVLLVSFFGGDILKMMTAEEYHSAAKNVFYIALIPFAQGLYFMFSSGLEFTKNPIYRPIISGAGLLTVLLTNHWLIKHFGIPGAPISIVLSWLVMAIGNLVYAQKLYKINYNWILIVGVSMFIFGIGYYINDVWNVSLFQKIALTISILVITIYFINNKYNLKQFLQFKK